MSWRGRRHNEHAGLSREDRRRLAIVALLQLGDAPDLVGVAGRPRGYRYTQSRDPKRAADLIKRDLGTAYVERRRHELGSDISAVISFHRSSRATIVELRRQA